MNNKIVGIFGVIFGLAILIVFFIGVSMHHDNIINYRSKVFAVKYFIPIVFINGAFYSIIFGILNYFEFLKPYLDNNDEYDKAKNHFFSIILLIPTWVSVTALIINRVDKKLPIVIWFIILIIICIVFLYSIKTIKNNR